MWRGAKNLKNSETILPFSRCPLIFARETLKPCVGGAPKERRRRRAERRLSERLFLESPFFFVAPFKLCSSKRLKSFRGKEEKKRTLQKDPSGQPFLRMMPSPLLWRALIFSEAWGPLQFQEKRPWSGKTVFGALREFRGILGATLGVQEVVLGIRSSILGIRSHDLRGTNTTILGATPRAFPQIDGNPHERFSFPPAFSERFLTLGVVTTRQKSTLWP